MSMILTIWSKNDRLNFIINIQKMRFCTLSFRAKEQIRNNAS